MAFFRRRPNALLAAATAIHPDDRADKPSYDSWQDEGWWMFDNLGEFRQGVTWLGNILSRGRLVAALAPVNPGDEPEPLDDSSGDQAVDLVAAIGGGISGQAELLRSATVHLTVPGEGWMVAETEDDDAAWRFYSADEIRVRTHEDAKVYEVQIAANVWRPLAPECLPVRVWRPHDRYHYRADSSTRAALPIMRRLELLNRHIDAIAQSRLASNGIYWLPSEIDFPANPAYPDAKDPFIAQFMDLGVTAIQTPGSAAAAMPFVARAPADYIEKIRYDTFSSPFEKELLANREFEIRRLSTAIDIPPEVLLGLGGSNHWSAWAIEESALKTTVTSLYELIAGALTRGYLDPAMGIVDDETRARAEADGVEIPPPPAEDARKHLVWYDLSELSVRPDRSTDAITLLDHFLLDPASAMREAGFGEADKITPADFKRMLGIKLVQDASTVEIGLELLGIETQASVSKGAPPGGWVPAEGNGAAPPKPLGPPQTDEAPPPALAPGASVPPTSNGA